MLKPWISYSVLFKIGHFQTASELRSSVEIPPRQSVPQARQGTGNPYGSILPRSRHLPFRHPWLRRLAERLEKKLEDDYLCWFNIPGGPKALQPDFVIMHPMRGLLVLEVKGRGVLYGSEDSVKIVIMHSSKGLEFGLVWIPNLGDMPKKGEEEADEARVLYVAMTRAIDRLVMTYREPSRFTRRIQDSGFNRQRAPAPGRDGLKEGSRLI